MKRVTSIVAALALILGMAALIPQDQASAVSSAALSIVPKKNYTIEPGKSVKDTLIIRNLDEKEPLELSLRVVDFSFKNDTGTPNLMLDVNAPQTTWSLKRFLSVPDSVVIPPKQSRTLDISVKIPSNQGAGSYYSAIVYSSGASDSGNVGLSASGVTLAFVNIPGKVNENLKLEKFGIYETPKSDKESGYKFSTTTQPKTIAYTLKNEGNVTEAPVGSITIKNIFGFGKERTISDVNPNGSLALIGQSRTYVACIQLEAEEVKFDGTQSRSKSCANPGLWPGYYSAKLNLLYGQNGNQTKEVTGSAGFWYLPWWFVFIVLVVLLVAAYFIWKLVRVVREKLYGITPKKTPRRKK